MLEKSQRPWGRYEVLQESVNYKVKSIHVNPGQRLSYQRHQKRAEHWYITQGIGQVTIDGKISSVSPGSVIEIAVNQLHRIANTGDIELIFIEVQTGTYFGEDDIERIEDDFGR
jgi:mannose-6-phosphate isomerase